MNNLVHIVDEESQDPVSNRYSIFTQNLMLAEMVSKHQHLTPRASVLNEDDETSFHSAPSRVPSATLIAEAAKSVTSTPANIGRPRTRGRRRGPAPSSDWTWRPNIPERISSMNTRRKNDGEVRRPDLATFHRRSCQLFASLDSTIATPASAGSDHSRSSSGTSPSLASSISTQATSILDDHWPLGPAFPSFHLDLDTELMPAARRSSDLGDFSSRINNTPRLGPRRSSSQLSPHITTTEQKFWTSDASREAEYAKIDAAHTGFKGLVKRIFPRRWSWLHGKRRDFYARPMETNITRKSISHGTDSIRRFRVSTSSQVREAEQTVEQDTKFLCPQIPAPIPPVCRHEETRLDLETGFVRGKPSKSRQVNKAIAKVRSSDALSKMFRKGDSFDKKAKRRSAQL